MITELEYNQAYDSLRAALKSTGVKNLVMLTRIDESRHEWKAVASQRVSLRSRHLGFRDRDQYDVELLERIEDLEEQVAELREPLR